MITRRHFTLTLAALPFAVAKTGAAHAQSYPAKPIRFVVPFPAGGSTDVGARLIAESLSRAFGQQVYVENKSGANGTIGVEDAAKSAPDGYTILVTIDTVASNPHVFHTNIDPTKDLLPIIQVSRQPIVLAAHPSLGVNSLAELIALAKKQPGLPYATGSGLGSPQHMAVQWFAQIAGITLEQVPYRGGGQAINDLLGGHVKLGSLGSTPLIPHYKAGTLAPAGANLEDPVTEPSRCADLSKRRESRDWFSTNGSACSRRPEPPPEVANRLNSEINKAIADPAVRKNLLDSAQEPVGGTAEQFATLVREDYAKFGRLVKDLNIKAE